jgi:hypothetical protein
MSNPASHVNSASRGWSRVTRAKVTLAGLTLAIAAASVALAASWAESSTGNQGGQIQPSYIRALGRLKVDVISCNTEFECRAIASNVRANSVDYWNLRFRWGSPIVMTRSSGLSGNLSTPESMACTTVNRCIVAGESSHDQYGTLLTTDDGGVHWSTIHAPKVLGGFLAIACNATSVCIATGVLGAIYSHDGGRTWRRATYPKGLTIIGSVTCLMGNRCVGSTSTAQPGFVVESIDRGHSWRTVSVGASRQESVWPVVCAAQQCIAVRQSESQSGSTIHASFSTAWLRDDSKGVFVRSYGASKEGLAMGASCFAAGSCMVVGVNESGSGPMWVSTQNYGRSWLSVVLSRGSGIVNSAVCTPTGRCVAQLSNFKGTGHSLAFVKL